VYVKEHRVLLCATKLMNKDCASRRTSV